MFIDDGEKLFPQYGSKYAQAYVPGDCQYEAVKEKGSYADGVAQPEAAYEPVVQHTEGVDYGKSQKAACQQALHGGMAAVGSGSRDKGSHDEADKVAECGLEDVADTAAPCEYGKSRKSEEDVDEYGHRSLFRAEEHSCKGGEKELQCEWTDGNGYAYECAHGGQSREQGNEYKVFCFHAAPLYL